MILDLIGGNKNEVIMYILFLLRFVRMTFVYSCVLEIIDEIECGAMVDKLSVVGGNGILYVMGFVEEGNFLIVLWLEISDVLLMGTGEVEINSGSFFDRVVLGG